MQPLADSADLNFSAKEESHQAPFGIRNLIHIDFFALQHDVQRIA